MLTFLRVTSCCHQLKAVIRCRVRVVDGGNRLSNATHDHQWHGNFALCNTPHRSESVSNRQHGLTFPVEIVVMAGIYKAKWTRKFDSQSDQRKSVRVYWYHLICCLFLIWLFQPSRRWETIHCLLKDWTVNEVIKANEILRIVMVETNSLILLILLVQGTSILLLHWVSSLLELLELTVYNMPVLHNKSPMISMETRLALLFLLTMFPLTL